MIQFMIMLDLKVSDYEKLHMHLSLHLRFYFIIIFSISIPILSPFVLYMLTTKAMNQ